MLKTTNIIINLLMKLMVTIIKDKEDRYNLMIIIKMKILDKIKISNLIKIVLID